VAPPDGTGDALFGAHATNLVQTCANSNGRPNVSRKFCAESCAVLHPTAPCTHPGRRSLPDVDDTRVVRRRGPVPPELDLLHEAVEPRTQFGATPGERVDRVTVRTGRGNLAPDTAEGELQTLDLEVST